MPSEGAMQQRFANGLLDASEAAPDFVRDPQGAHAPRRYDVYRNNVVVSLIEAMEQGFPKTRKIVGEAFFRDMARIYVIDHPPASPLMMYYGESFADFIAGFEPAQSLPYLPDLARMEYAWREAYFAGDQTVLGAAWFEGQDGDVLMASRFDLHPSVRIIASKFPIYDIWRFQEDSNHQISPQAQDVMLYRPQSDVLIAKLPNGFAEFATELQKVSFGEALENVKDSSAVPEIVAVFTQIATKEKNA